MKNNERGSYVAVGIRKERKFSRCTFVERVLHYQCWFFYYFREMKLTHNGIVSCTKRQKELYTLESAERGEKKIVQ